MLLSRIKMHIYRNSIENQLTNNVFFITFYINIDETIEKKIDIIIYHDYFLKLKTQMQDGVS